MTQSLYDHIGQGYNHRRRADPRILATLLETLALRPESSVLDVGAGTGNYTAEIATRGHRVCAVEPSQVMFDARTSAPGITWSQAVAESLPYPDATFDAVYCTLALHHFTDPARALGEIARVTKPGGRFVAFTSDPRRIPPDFWMLDYFGELFTEACEVFPPEQTLVNQLKAGGYVSVTLRHFPLPHDVQDGFFCSAWRRPHDYLDATFRAGISSFRLMAPNRLHEIIERLRTDLTSGSWLTRYEAILTRETYDAGYLFASATKPASLGRKTQTQPDASSANTVSPLARRNTLLRLNR